MVNLPVETLPALYSPDPEVLVLLRERIPCASIATSRLDQFLRASSRARCLVVGVPQLTSGADLPSILSLLRTTQSPKVLVTRLSAENARRLGKLQVDEVVWLAEIDQRLEAAVHRAIRGGALEAFATRLRTTRALPPTVAEVVELACSAPYPPRTVGEVVNVTGRDRRTLWHHWQPIKRRGGPTLKQSLAWVALLRACQLRGGGRSWTSVARALHWEQKALRRWSHALLGEPLSALTPERLPDLLAEFEFLLIAGDSG